MLFKSFIIISAFALLGLFSIFLFFRYFGGKKMQLRGVSRFFPMTVFILSLVMPSLFTYLLELNQASSVDMVW